jgi:hypothetical protein
MKEWIEMSKLHKDQMGDDEIFMQELLKSQGEPPQEKSKSKQMSEKDWERRFLDLLKLDLIELPEDFYEENMLFEEPEKLMDVFTQLEEQNLTNISKTQELEESMEKMKQKEIRTHKTIGGELSQQQAVKKELETQILVSKMTLNELQKASRTTTVSASQGKKAKAGEEEQEVNIHALMEDIKKDILDVYGVTGAAKDGAATEGK